MAYRNQNGGRADGDTGDSAEEGDPHASPRIAEFQRCHLVACLKNEVLIEEVLKEMKIGLGGSHRALQDVFDNSMQLNSADEKVAESLMEPKREQLRAT